MSEEAEVLFEKKGVVGLITLNRPKALNALTHNMVKLMDAQLRNWSEDDSIDVVVIVGAGEKAFCAGGDIRVLYDQGQSGDSWKEFYWDEYRLNRLIKTFAKPYIAIVDGIDMGGGVGVSINGGIRIGTERLVFAMPETGIGLFPDVGGSNFLPACPGEVGMFLGLSGRRLKAADALYAGIIDHYMDSSRTDELIKRLSAGEAIGSVLNAVCSAPDAPALQQLQEDIDRHFGRDSAEEIVASLQRGGTWAQELAAEIDSKCPLSVKVAFRQIRDGAKLDFDDCMRMEYRIVNRIMKQPNFYEGVRAVIIDKDQDPQWQPATLTEVGAVLVDSHFVPLGENGGDDLHYD